MKKTMMTLTITTTTTTMTTYISNYTVKGCSLVVDYDKFIYFLPVITLWLSEVPVFVLRAFEKGAQEKVLSLYPRDITALQSGKFVHIGGTVIHRSGVFVYLIQGQYECECSYLFDPVLQNTELSVNVGPCPNCQSQTSCYKSAQVVTGIYMKKYGFLLQNDFRAYAAVIEANNVAKKEDIYLTDEDKEEICRLSRHPKIGERIIKRIAPSVVGHEYVKTPLALPMFGGREVNEAGEPILCRDINVLLVCNDNNTLKSQFLKSVEDTAPKAVRASVEKLTVQINLNRDDMEWAFEVSSPVLADNGICIIDDLDQIYIRDREKIHNAMKNQLIDVRDVGIKVPLEARCSFIAAATLIGGRYDYSKVFQENVELEDPFYRSLTCYVLLRWCGQNSRYFVPYQYGGL